MLPTLQIIFKHWPLITLVDDPPSHFKQAYWHSQQRSASTRLKSPKSDYWYWTDRLTLKTQKTHRKILGPGSMVRCQKLLFRRCPSVLPRGISSLLHFYVLHISLFTLTISFLFSPPILSQLPIGCCLQLNSVVLAQIDKSLWDLRPIWWEPSKLSIRVSFGWRI